jgi:hypothetical protein
MGALASSFTYTVKTKEDSQTIHEVKGCLNCVAVLMHIVEEKDTVWAQKSCEVSNEASHYQPDDVEY